MTPGTSRCTDILVSRCVALGRPPAGFLEPLGGAELIRNGLGTLGACGKGYKKTGTKNLPNKTAAQAIHQHTLRIPIRNSNPDSQSKDPRAFGFPQAGIHLFWRCFCGVLIMLVYAEPATVYPVV